MRAREGEMVPALEVEPVLPIYWLPVWRAFLTLNRCRPSGFGLGGIPMAEIKSYLDLFDYPDVEEFVSCIKEMDSVYLEHCEKQSKVN